MDELKAFLFGTAVAAAVGPIALLIVTNGINHGARAALLSALGVALADLSYAAAAIGGGAALAASLASHQSFFEAAAATVLLLLGIGLAYRARWSRVASPVNAQAPAVGLLSAFFLTLGNPLTLLLFTGFSAQLMRFGGWAHAARCTLLIFFGSLLVQVGYALFGASLQRFARCAARLRALNMASGLVIATFGAIGLQRALSSV